MRMRGSGSSSSKSKLYEDGSELRRGPWTLEEDNLLIQYITCHGEGRWNSSAKYAGLNRRGKSCRLRWLNYLKPDIKRGNLTPHDQLLILQLHSKWGNRWSKIAQHLPGRTDNEIKNYWRTKVQKQAKQLKVDSNSKKFLEAIGMYWMPNSSSPSSSISTQNSTLVNQASCLKPSNMVNNSDSNSTMEILDSPGAQSSSKISSAKSLEDDSYHVDIPSYDMQELESHDISISECHMAGIDWFGEDLGSTFWNTDELWQFKKAGEIGV